ncbi:MAG: IS110 family transposase [Syntrophales bacterium LBB04]|nr:IS110 family transposase [Syntrophales bacterium LBB04]
MRGLRAKRVRSVKEGTLIGTVDIGATTNTGYCTTIDGRDVKVFKFGNIREGFEKFWHMVVAAQNRFKCKEVVVGYESTGPYAEPLVHYLLSKPVNIVQVSPLHTKRLKEVNDNSPGKTDDKDPRVIADIIKLGRSLSVVIPEGDAAHLRRLNNARERHVGERTALLNQMQQLVFLIFPEFKMVIKQMRGRTVRFILNKYTTPERIGTLDKKVLGEEMRKRSMGKLGIKDAELLINLAQSSVGIKEGVAGIALDLQHIIAQLDAVDGFTAEIEAEMASILPLRIPRLRPERALASRQPHQNRRDPGGARADPGQRSARSVVEAVSGDVQLRPAGPERVG